MNRADLMHVTYQTIPAPDADGQYAPDYDALIAAASCPEEADYIRSIEASGMKFAYNMVYVTRQACGHFEIFQTPRNVHYPLKDNLDLARKTAAERKCTRCICGW